MQKQLIFKTHVTRLIVMNERTPCNQDPVTKVIFFTAALSRAQGVYDATARKLSSVAASASGKQRRRQPQQQQQREQQHHPESQQT